MSGQDGRPGPQVAYWKVAMGVVGIALTILSVVIMVGSLILRLATVTNEGVPGQWTLGVYEGAGRRLWGDVCLIDMTDSPAENAARYLACSEAHQDAREGR